MKIFCSLLVLALLVSCTPQVAVPAAETTDSVATFAGGCFWCTEADFQKVGFTAVSGYTGGTVKNPAYKEVASGTTGHREAVQVFYDSKTTSYEDLLRIFFTHVNPTDTGGQFVDRGFQYSPAIYYHNEAQHQAALAAVQTYQPSFAQPITLAIEPAGIFYRAEEYHQDYYQKSSVQYKFYRFNSGRDQYLEAQWAAAE